MAALVGIVVSLSLFAIPSASSTNLVIEILSPVSVKVPKATSPLKVPEDPVIVPPVTFPVKLPVTLPVTLPIKSPSKLAIKVPTTKVVSDESTTVVGSDSKPVNNLNLFELLESLYKPKYFVVPATAYLP